VVSGPVGLAALLTAQLYSPAEVYMIDLDENRLAVAKELGATDTFISGQTAIDGIMAKTNGRGVDTVMEAVGSVAAFELCQELIAPGGTIANIGVHASKANLHLDKLWNKNICELNSSIPDKLV
jgi:alcohol dehydrogenase